MKEGQVFVFRPPSDPPIGHLRQAAGIGKRLLESDKSGSGLPLNNSQNIFRNPIGYRVKDSIDIGFSIISKMVNCVLVIGQQQETLR